MEEETLDVNAEETAGNSSDPEVQPGSEPVQTPEQKEQIVEELLADGTPKTKKVPLDYERFKHLTEKAKAYDELQAELAQKPPLEDRLAAVEETIKKKQREELRAVISEAADIWTDFAKRYRDEIRPIAEALEQQGLSPKDAIQRAYFAVNPDAVRGNTRLVRAQEAQNRMGTFSSGGGVVKPAAEAEESYPLTDADKEFMRQMEAKGFPMNEKMYARHASSTPKI